MNDGIFPGVLDTVHIIGLYDGSCNRVGRFIVRNGEGEELYQQGTVRAPGPTLGAHVQLHLRVCSEFKPSQEHQHRNHYAHNHQRNDSEAEIGDRKHYKHHDGRESDYANRFIVPPGLYACIGARRCTENITC